MGGAVTYLMFEFDSVLVLVVLSSVEVNYLNVLSVFKIGAGFCTGDHLEKFHL